MADDLTLGELARTLARFEARVDRALKGSDDRHADLASKMVPTALWKAEHEALENAVSQLRDEVRDAIREARASIDRTSLERMAVLTEKIDALGRRIGAHEKAHAAQSTWTRSRTWQAVGIAAGAVAAIAAAWIGAIAAAKGVH